MRQRFDFRDGLTLSKILEVKVSAKEFDDKGFLSDYVFAHREKVLVEYSGEFSECGAISARAQNFILTTPVSESEQPLVCSLLFAERTVRTCQAAIRLCEMGLIQEAQVLARTALETLFHSSALLVNPGVLENIQSHDDKEGFKFAASILKELPADQISPEDLIKLQEMMDRGGGDTFSVYDSAEAAGMLDLYAVQYRFLSALASHATFRSLDRSFAPEGGKYAFYMGPSVSQLKLTLSIISKCLSASVLNLEKIKDSVKTPSD
jgi:hypothetical protein